MLITRRSLQIGSCRGRRVVLLVEICLCQDVAVRLVRLLPDSWRWSRGVRRDDTVRLSVVGDAASISKADK